MVAIVRDIDELLAANGHRLTASRRAVMEAMLAGDDLFSVADVLGGHPKSAGRRYSGP